MNNRTLIVDLAVAVCLGLVYVGIRSEQDRGARSEVRAKRFPRISTLDPRSYSAAACRPVSQDGRAEVVCDLPGELQKRNVGGRDGAVLCVFTSVMHSARYQNEPRLWDE
jgi:hypothetical protein